ncbi:hypothetical protein [Streptomyces sp. S.PNR 29]|uniref:hypothetical protein n=1 Tax=Streptomyces sp. S.PNR 29 TaxID=2973805 RepID=UPI0025B155A2|nr:hypothetical protein [Streptomyces sp. S.PNR 29]MDN0199397.1 hypothetical protein [Streptomyces sp. S.PNR 29]
MVCAVALPFAVASAGPVGDEGRSLVRSLPPADDRAGKARPAADGASRTAAEAPSADAVRCGPELASSDGVEAQTCVLAQGGETWGRTYYRNPTGAALDSVLSLMGPRGRTVQIHCQVDAEDEPAMCETPRERTRGELAAYTAVAEFAERTGRQALLLRSGSNSPPRTGS